MTNCLIKILIKRRGEKEKSSSHPFLFFFCDFSFWIKTSHLFFVGEVKFAWVSFWNMKRIITLSCVKRWQHFYVTRGGEHVSRLASRNLVTEHTKMATRDIRFVWCVYRLRGHRRTHTAVVAIIFKKCQQTTKNRILTPGIDVTIHNIILHYIHALYIF